MVAIALPALAENRIDTIRPDAPELAAYGSQAIGVRTLHFVNPKQIDVVTLDPKAARPDPLPRYDRPITVEVWYPAEAAQGETTLKAIIRDGKTEVLLQGKAVRDAAPAKGTFPLVVVSHGFPGNRYLMSPLAENIASKGYVVVSIDHTDSTYDGLSDHSFASTLVNRSLDQLFVLNQIAKLSREPAFFLHGRVDAANTAIIGYSMGGYGALITAGAGLTRQAVETPDKFWSVPFGLLGVHQSGSQSHADLFDPRIKTAIFFAPAGWSWGMFDADSVKGLKIPALFVGGSLDDIVQYDTGIRPTWAAASGIDRALLTFDNAGHNAGAPMPAPREADIFNPDHSMNYATHYIDAVWDNVRMNNIAEHFVTAWLGKYLKADPTMDAYLDLTPDSNGNSWKGFPEHTARGLRFERLKAGQ
jgi:predicted dienelactone hydrolase